MGRGRRHRYDDDEPRGGSRPARTRPKRGNRYLLPILLAVGIGLVGLVVVACCGGYMLFGVDRSSDPAKAQATLDAMGDMQLPAGFTQCQTIKEMTGVVSVEYRSTSGRSYLYFTTGSAHPLRYPDSMRDARESGREMAGKRREMPTAEQTIPGNVRGQPAGYKVLRYANSEDVKGFFQGKKYAVQFYGEFDLTDFPAGTAAAFVQTIR